MGFSYWDLAQRYGLPLAATGEAAYNFVRSNFPDRWPGKGSYSVYGGLKGGRKVFTGLDFYGSRTVTGTEEEKNRSMDQSTGLRRRVYRKVRAGRKKFSMQKVLGSSVQPVVQMMGVRTGVEPYDWSRRTLVSEYNPGCGGFFPIGKYSVSGGRGYLPMHIYDLNYVCGSSGGWVNDDHEGNWPELGTDQCDNINSRHWNWMDDNTWKGSAAEDTAQFRYHVENPTSQNALSTYPAVAAGPKVYRKGIHVKMNLYGCTKIPTEFDVRIIKIMDPKMCPDYPISLTNTTGETALRDFQQNWQNLVYPYTVNPILKGVEPGPTASGMWFKTIAKKRVRIGEQTSEVDQVPCAEVSMYVKLNEVNNHRWDNTGRTLETGPTFYDEVRAPDEIAASTADPQGRPYFTSRYYLLIRALAPVDTNATDNPDGSGVDAGDPGVAFLESSNPMWKVYPQGLTNATKVQYIPSYDLVIRNSYMASTQRS